jgi:hypothetical protein
MPNALLLVFSDPTDPNTEDAYNTWYSEKHLHDLLKIDGVIAATRYRLPKGIETMPGIGSDPHGYLAIYEVEAEDDQALVTFTDNLKAALAAGTAEISATMNAATLTGTFCLPIGPRVSRDSPAAEVGR